MAPSGITVHLTKDTVDKEAVLIQPYNEQNYQELKKWCLQQQCLFQDPVFEAAPKSLGKVNGIAGSQVIWKRPKEICRAPKFICEGIDPTDVCQGQLGNCWFVAAAATLTLYPRYLHRVVDQGQSFRDNDYAGIFHFQFWQYGQWVDVVVDDLLPTVDGKLIFAYSANLEEFWMPLLEKAYAKLTGSYAAMEGGLVKEALVDFTGGIGETHKLKIPNPELFQIIQAAVNKCSLMGASIKGDISQAGTVSPEGLGKGHAYSITAVHKLEMEGKKSKLLRLRNPWGKREWNGRWSDQSELWLTLDPVLRNKLQVDKEDGEFWMQLSDFVKYFDNLDICHLSADAMDKDKEGVPFGWNVNCFHGRWIHGQTAGGQPTSQPHDTFWMNPQFHITLQEADEPILQKQKKKARPFQDPTCSLLVSLRLKNWRRDPPKNFNSQQIGFYILKVPKEYLQLRTVAQRREMLPHLQAATLPFSGSPRDITTTTYQLPPGDYIIIPYVTSALVEADFVLRIFTEKQHQFLEITDEIKAEEKTLQVIMPETGQDPWIESAFLERAGQDQQMGTAELQRFLNWSLSTNSHIKMDGFSLDACQAIIQHFSDQGKGKLTLKEVKQLWAKIQKWGAIFIQFDMDWSGTMNTHEMRLALDAAGFHLNAKTSTILLQKYGNHWLQIDFDTFISFLVHLECIFRKCMSLDSDGDGQIYMTQEEWIKRVLST